MAKGRNTSWLLDKEELRLVSNNQVSGTAESEREVQSAETDLLKEDNVRKDNMQLGQQAQEVDDGAESSAVNTSVVEPRRSERARREPHRWTYGEGFRPTDEYLIHKLKRTSIIHISMVF